MPLKTWAPYDRLLAGDLNANFTAAVRHPLPGVYVGQGSPVSIAANATTEVPGAAPISWQDPLGYWSSGRVVIPPSWGGIYQVSATVLVTGGTGPRRLTLAGTSTIRASVGGAAGIGMYVNASGIWNMPASTTTYVEVLSSTDGCTATLINLSLMRLAPAIGAPESLLKDLLEAGLLDAEVFPEGAPLPGDEGAQDTPPSAGDADTADTPPPAGDADTADTPPPPRRTSSRRTPPPPMPGPEATRPRPPRR